MHWELEITTMDLFMATEVLCRAWDESQNTQPDKLTWTLLGQGNNSQFRLRLHKEVDDQVSSTLTLSVFVSHTAFCDRVVSLDSGNTT